MQKLSYRKNYINIDNSVLNFNFKEVDELSVIENNVNFSYIQTLLTNYKNIEKFQYFYNTFDFSKSNEYFFVNSYLFNNIVNQSKVSSDIQFKNFLFKKNVQSVDLINFFKQTDANLFNFNTNNNLSLC
jgi:hypothetical protein